MRNSTEYSSSLVKINISILYSTGSLQYYIPIHTTLLWLCHIITMLCAINYPFRVRRLFDNSKHSRCIHVTLLLACSLPPAVIVGCSFAVGDYVTQFPPVYCTAEDPNTTYYLQSLPLSIVCAAGVTGFVLILWSLVKRRKTSVSNCGLSYTSVANY